MTRTFALTLVSFWIASSALAQVRLQDLVVGHAVEKKARFDVADITVGTTSVLRLFLPLQNRAPLRARALGGRNEIILKVRDTATLSTLRAILLMAPQPRLRLHLVDRGLMPRLSTFLHPVVTLEASSAMEIPLVVAFTPCERTTRIVYTSIDSILNRELARAGQTHLPVTLDEVFARLVKEDLDPFLAKLEPSEKDDPCFTTFTLLKWVRNQEAQGFEFSRYRLNDAPRDVLSIVATASGNVLQQWRLYALQIDVTGYTDAIAFETALPVDAESTGVASTRDPVRISYAGCANDRLTGREPQFLDFHAPAGTPVGATIDDNCELGASRAWVAAAFLLERLGTNHVAYRYGTGGIANAQGMKENEALQRKVGVRITVRAANDH